MVGYHEDHNCERLPRLKFAPTVGSQADQRRPRQDWRGRAWRWACRVGASWNAAHWGWQLLHSFAACLFTNAISYRGLSVGDNLGQLILMSWASLCTPHLNPATAAGAYAGMVAQTVVPSYAWLLLLAAVIAAVWRTFVILNILVGWGGRLGTSAFVATNLVLVIVLCPAGVTPWTVYWEPTYWAGLSYQAALVSTAGAGVSSLLTRLVCFARPALGQSAPRPPHRPSSPRRGFT